MTILHNRKKYQSHLANTLVSRLLAFCILTISLSSYAVPPVKNCKRDWSQVNITPGMQFGDFAIESGSGTITLNGGGARTSGGTVDLASAGSAVSSHQISITNTLDPDCAIYGISFEWQKDPTATPMKMVGGTDIPMSNVLLHIPGETGSPFTLPTPTLYLNPASLPITIEVTSQMATAFPQVGGAYASAPYRLQLIQDGRSARVSGRATSFSITPLTLTPGVNMDFGLISSGSAGGTIILNETSGARSVGSGDADVVSNAAAGTPGTFTIQGDIGLTFNVSYVNGVLTDPAGGNAMTISGFTDTTAAITLTGAADPFSVGATLTLSGSQPAGNYSTANPGGVPYSITVNYN